MVGISIVVCCYNSASRIDETLKYAFSLNIPQGWEFEILVVDNNSTDSTKDVAENAFRRYGRGVMHCSVIHEPIAGLASARQRGVRESQFDCILFCDDDNHLEMNYLKEVKKIFDENPAIGIIGGWCRPSLTVTPGKWIEDFFGALAIQKFPEKDRFVNWVVGAGMVVKKEIYSKLFQEQIQLLLTGRLGAKQTSGEDTEFCFYAKFLGYQIYYSSFLKLDHCISASRLNRWNFLKTAHQNFYPAMYLQQLESFILSGAINPQKLYRQSLWQRFVRIIYFVPRCIIGRHQFYSFINTYSNFLFFIWMLRNFSCFLSTHKMIRANLSI
jgi:glycosyltransferase involved in cell wall biosynthesis